MANDGSMSLSDELIAKLAEVVVLTNMQTIAISHLKIESVMVANLKISHQGNPVEFNRAVLTIWKHMNPGTDQVQVSFKPKISH